MVSWSLWATALAVAFHLAASLKGFPAPEQIFRQYDRNRDGSLVGDELSGLLKSLGFSPEESDQMRGEIDRNGDQLVSQREFKLYLTNPIGAAEDEQVDAAPPPQAMQPNAKQRRAPPEGTQGQAAAGPAAGAAEATMLDDSVAAPAALDVAVAGEAPSQAAGHEGATGAPFGKEDAALELQAMSSKAQDGLIDAIETAEVAEIKRAVFRALSRLRAAQLKEFDTIAKLETQMIDEYNDNHHHRREAPASDLAGQEDPAQADKAAALH